MEIFCTLSIKKTTTLFSHFQGEVSIKLDSLSISMNSAIINKKEVATAYDQVYCRFSNS